MGNEYNEAIPVTVLTGFLGSGKTTLINRILKLEHGLKIAVIVNEFGDISIDDKLISDQAQNIIELANGCICCSMQGDLLKAVHQVTARSFDVDYVLLETSGLSDPLPVATSILNDVPGNTVRLDGIVTLVDAANFDANLENAEVAFSQLVNTDLILINKIDLVEENIPGLIRQGIKKINRSAGILTCVNGNVEPSLLLDVKISGLDAGYDPSADGHHHNNDLSEFDSISFESSKPVKLDLFRTFVDDMPECVFRGKGILNVADDDHRHIFHLVGNRCVITKGKPWPPDDKPNTQLVLIGRQLGNTDMLEQLNHTWQPHH